MKVCSKCGEANGDSRTTCFRCMTTLPKNDNYKKICPKCGTIYAANAEYCNSCHSQLGVYDDRVSQSSSNSSSDGCWMYAVSIIIPFIGIILGLIYIAKGDDELGKSLIITGVIATIIWPIFGIFLGSCLAL